MDVEPGGDPVIGRPSESQWVYLSVGVVSLLGVLTLLWGGEWLLESLGVHLEEPGFLWGLLLVPAALIARAHTISDLPHGQLLMSCVLRSLAIIALVLALTNPTTVHQVPALTSTVFVVDVSASMSDDALERARVQVEDAWRRRGDREVRLVVTAQRAMEVPLTARGQEPLPPLPRPELEEGLQTNLQAGVRLAYGLLPEDRVPHIVLITDGVQTQGSLLDELATAERFGVRIHHLDLSDIPRPPEVMVTDLKLPESVEAR
ncbi:MAG: vWA domain-containing protein, partial [Myxococcota bacterium]|nr:vWA domain-containing protein [Myxococcota bacterium]